MRILLPLLLISAAACTPTAREMQQEAASEAGQRAALDHELAGLTPGRPQDCVQLRDLTGPRSFGDTLVYRSGRTRYVNQTAGGCGRVGDDAYIVTRTPSTQLCRGDIATVVSRSGNFPVGSCSFNSFTPYAPAH